MFPEIYELFIYFEKQYTKLHHSFEIFFLRNQLPLKLHSFG